jgi:hypothetical protein
MPKELSLLERIRGMAEYLHAAGETAEQLEARADEARASGLLDNWTFELLLAQELRKIEQGKG